MIPAAEAQVPLKKHVKRSFRRDLASVFSGKVVVLTISFLTSVVVTRYLGADLKGIMTALLVYPALLHSLGEMGVKQAAVYHLGMRSHAESDIVRSLSALFLLTTALAVATCLIIYWMRANPAFTQLMIVLALCTIPIGFAKSYASAILLGKQMISEFARVNWMPAILIFIISVLLVRIVKLEIIGAQLASLFGAIPFLIYALCLVRKVGPLWPAWRPLVLKQLLAMGSLYALSLFLIGLNYKLAIVLMDRLSTPAELGRYSLGISLAELVWQLPMAIAPLIFTGSANAENGLVFSHKISRMSRLVILIAAAFSATVAFAADRFVLLVYGISFAGTGEVIRCLLPGVVALTLFKVLNADLAGKGRPMVVMWASIPSLIVNVCLNFLWIPAYGAKGAASAASVSYCLFAGIFVNCYCRITQMSPRDVILFRSDDWAWLKENIWNLTARVFGKRSL